MEARNRTLPEWLNRVASGQIRLPRFQRHEAWTHDRVSKLLQTVLRELPAGATLILEIGDKEPFISRQIIGAPAPKERAAYCFFRDLPRDHGFRGAPEDYIRSGELPFFELRELGKRYMVRFNRDFRFFPLRRLVQLTARGGFHWRQSISVRKMILNFVSRKSNCRECGKLVSFVGIDSIRNMVPCGLRLNRTRRKGKFERLVPNSHIPLVQKFLRTEVGERLGCNLVTLPNTFGPYGCFLCPRCGTESASWLEDRPGFREDSSTERKHSLTVICTGRTYRYPHWCVAGRHGFCSDVESAPYPGEWLNP